MPNVRLPTLKNTGAEFSTENTPSVPGTRSYLLLLFFKSWFDNTGRETGERWHGSAAAPPEQKEVVSPLDIMGMDEGTLAPNKRTATE